MARTRGYDEDTVVAAAQDQFWATGYRGTSLDMLLSATGLGKGSLYNSFGSKRALYLRAFDRYCHDQLAEIAAGLDGPDHKAAARLRRYIDTQIGGLGRRRGQQDVPRGCFIAKAAAEMAAEDPEVAAIATRALERLGDLLADCIRAAQRAGDIDPDRSARALGRMLLVAQRGAEALAEAGVGSAVMKDVAKELTSSVLPELSRT
ncbi:TetR/AcrR family transcriptional regulator [Microlunatus soli]|uniref:DNA-binding transcriptional regulator, AcrR family n=1 Tax=Microlunatus soli TaxID=630515 RepID=A0A1H1YQA5_9ACTN|nr:TetR/AcrR family transcriptional regulator [Microlunatus soli]SDT23591.1 DNA-binding transcriptional regulator, AcrR family [Microlunatus soli]